MVEEQDKKFWINEIKIPNVGLIVAACDKEILGKTLKKGSMDVYISPHFYGGILVDEIQLIQSLKRADSINLVGREVIEIAEKLDLIHKDAKIYFRDSEGNYIPHAIMIKMNF
ncbi:MAG: DUF424 domain-containing protein [Candidatus Njordarchaeia archaeon]